MGVLSFYRWLINKYPKIIVNVVEEKLRGDDDIIDTTLPNPNRIEFDNLYLDMNGIIHPCFHPEGDHPPPPRSFDDVFNNMFDYIDRLFLIVRPRKLLYLAIDGVAPRAKMNQQRSRRFRNAKDCEISELEEKRLQREFERDGKYVFPKEKSQTSDSNIITPGSKFMHELAKALQSYVHLRLKNNIGWKNVKVILSDANVPGEGEHKIMSFIRTQRTFQDYDPETRHCIYGLDADLIMLALSTHEVHFSILREDLLIPEHPVYQPTRKSNIGEVELSFLKTKDVAKICLKPYQFLHIWILREYLELDLNILEPPANMKIDLERIIDDFIFICFFMGNDFLPHMPSLQIQEGAIDLLIHVYKEEFKKTGGGYLVDVQFVEDDNMRYINLKRVEKFLLSVGQKEELIFKKRTELRERTLRRLVSQSSNLKEDIDELASNSTSSVIKCSVSMPCESAASSNADNYSSMEENTRELKERLTCWSRDRLDLFKGGSFLVDKVKFGSPGWKERYYKEKLYVETKEDRESTRKILVQKYTEGLCWVLLYYFSGVPSWNWFYDYHYGPFASDLRGMSTVRVKFEQGFPFKPFDQLMGVLPPRSAQMLPKMYQDLMTSPDSGILDFYPSDFEVDTDGKRFMWQGICKLPFIDQKRLISATENLEAQLNDDEKIRNSTKNDVLFVRRYNVLGQQIFSVYKKQLHRKCTDVIQENIPAHLSCGINGSISPLDDISAMLNLTGDQESQKDTKDIEDDNSVICAEYLLPQNGHLYPRPLTNKFPEKTIYEADIMEVTSLWHEHRGNRNSYSRPLVQSHPRKTTTEIQSNSNRMSEGAIHKYAGTGWGAGRGNVFNPSTDRGENSSSSARAAHVHERGVGRGRGFQNQAWNMSGDRQNYRPSQPERGDNSGYFNSYGRGGQWNNKPWRQPNAAADDGQKYNEQIPRINVGSSNLNGGRGRGRGRGRNMPNAKASSEHWRVRSDSSK